MFARRHIQSAWLPDVIHILPPLMTYSSPFFTAVVLIPIPEHRKLRVILVKEGYIGPGMTGRSLPGSQKTIWFSPIPHCPITLPGHKANQSGQLLEGKPGEQDHFSHLPLDGVFIPVDDS